jgi:hypothetical protein
LNAYPSYEAYITYTIKNKGKMPAYLNSLTIKNPNPEALEISTTDHTGTWLQPDQTTQGTTTICILQAAKQNWQYQFQISIGISFQEKRPRSSRLLEKPIRQSSRQTRKTPNPSRNPRRLSRPNNRTIQRLQFYRHKKTEIPTSIKHS